MRKIEEPKRVIKGSAEYRRSTPPPKEPSPLRGKKQRWQIGMFRFRKRSTAMQFYTALSMGKHGTPLPKRVFV